MTKLNIKDIQADPKNPRQEFDPETMNILKDSIATHGILNPIIVEKANKHYLIIDGERRYRCARKLGLKEIPVTITETSTDLDRIVKRFHLQDQHKNWSIFEKANAISILKIETKWTAKELANALGMSVDRIAKYQLVLNLSKRLSTFIRSKKLPFDWVIEISQLISATPAEKRQDIENSVIRKIESNVVTRRRNIRQYKIAIKENPKIADKIISNEKYSSEQALIDAGAEHVQSITSIISCCAFIKTHSRIICNATTKVKIPDNLDTHLKNAKKGIEELLKLC